MAAEQDLQTKLIKFLRGNGCMFFKNTATPYSVKGTPDIFWFYEGMYGAIEVKAHKNSKKQPGQQDWIDKFEKWSYGRFIFLENWDEEKKYLEEILK